MLESKSKYMVKMKRDMKCGNYTQKATGNKHS